ncbi:MAG: hypothetical protein AYK19_12635 [Theionarchaea archaeon DG-70-1]|nr:MAG: hypothetical protein AYK19_12635 [Theionarchaea archaeon DG-70-1]
MDVCSHAVRVGEKSGADEVEAVWVKDVTTTVEAELGQISKASKVWREGLRIRVIRDEALGSFFTYQMDKNAVKTAVEKALAAAKASKKDEHWDSLPHPGKYSPVDVWDSTMEEMDPRELTEPVCEMIQSLPDDIAVHAALNRITLLQRACVNSNGIEHEDKGTRGRCGMRAVGKLESGVTPVFNEHQFLRTYNPDPQKIVESITTKVNLFRHSDTASSGKFQVILSPRTLEILLYFTLFKAVSGENTARGKSLLAGKEGEKVACSQFTLHDNGIVKEGFESREMDDEGVPCQDTPLIKNGVLQGFIWNDYWAKRMGVASTGNAYYDDQNNEMSIQQTTMVVNPGDYTKEELFNVKDGYYILGLQGAHGSNPESGDFSVVCAPAYRIRNGEISGGCVGMMLSDNIFSLLQKIDAVGREPEVVDVAVLPHVRFRDVNVAAR